MIDWSATAAWIALAVSLISPLINAIVNNRHEKTMWKLRNTEQQRSALIEGYLRNAIAYIDDNAPAQRTEYARYMIEILPRASESLQKLIVELDDIMLEIKPFNTPPSTLSSARELLRDIALRSKEIT